MKSFVWPGIVAMTSICGFVAGILWHAQFSIHEDERRFMDTTAMMAQHTKHLLSKGKSEQLNKILENFFSKLERTSLTSQRMRCIDELMLDLDVASED